jgi:3-hydroxybutyryl-CoA dehydrogenase
VVQKWDRVPDRAVRAGRFIGLDVALDVLLYVHEQLGDAYYMPPRVLKELVHAGRLGQKTGEGFYEYLEEG